MSAQSRREFADGAMRLARDAAEGRIDPDDMVPAFLDETRELCGQVIGPGDPMWTVQVEITRDVLGPVDAVYDRAALALTAALTASITLAACGQEDSAAGGGDSGEAPAGDGAAAMAVMPASPASGAAMPGPAGPDLEARARKRLSSAA